MVAAAVVGENRAFSLEMGCLHAKPSFENLQKPLLELNEQNLDDESFDIKRISLQRTKTEEDRINKTEHQKKESQGAWNGIDLKDVRLHKKIGKGAFGTVYKGSYNGNKVAVKEVSRKAWEASILDDAYQEGADIGQSTIGNMAGEDLLREAAILSALSHPNTVHMFGVAVEWENGTISSYFFVTELCKISLDKMKMGLGKVDGPNLWDIIYQVAAGMSYLHSQRVIHRDLKPGLCVCMSSFVLFCFPVSNISFTIDLQEMCSLKK